MSALLLSLNAGSSSLKFALYEPGNLRCRFRGIAETSESGGRMRVETGGSESTYRVNLAAGRFQHVALRALADWLDQMNLTGSLAGAGHRVVHGGAEFTESGRIDTETLARMDRLAHLSPLHLPQNLQAIHLLLELMPELPQVACYDTAFHAGQSRIVRNYGLPTELSELGYVRYGFHGLSYEYIVSCLGNLFDTEVAKGRVIVAHLGNGASLCAIHNGRSIATTLGYSTLDGLVMGTRCGTLDPGLLLQLIRDFDGDVDRVERMLYKESGLLGVSGLSSDMRILLDSEDPNARLAVDLFVHRVQRECGSLVAAMGGVDALVFTGGIGARSGEIRERICAGLGWLGVALDPELNAAGSNRIEQSTSGVVIAAVTTDEEIVIARNTRSLVCGT